MKSNYAIPSNKTQGIKKYYFYVQSDSNSQGLLPGMHSNFSLELGAGINTTEPWPMSMKRILRENGVHAIVENFSESGRRLAGKTYIEGERCSVGEKDGRVALQSMLTSIINKHDSSAENVTIIIALGANDLQESDITPEYLKGSLIKHILTIMTNPNLQFNLLSKFDIKEYKRKS